ncbi:MAG: hypothetical protein GY930_08535 [bacterium]|nr:hypothetical protein [bacterium]
MAPFLKVNNRLVSLAAVSALILFGVSKLIGAWGGSPKAGHEIEEAEGVEKDKEAPSLPLKGIAGVKRGPVKPDGNSSEIKAGPSRSGANRYDHPEVVQAIADRYGVNAEEIALEIRSVWPDFFNLELAPLVPWAEAKKSVVDQVIAVNYGDSPDRQQRRYEEAVLRKTVDRYMAKIGIDEHLRHETGILIRRDLEGCRTEYEELKIEFDLALRVKLDSETIDRWAYVSLSSRRVHTLPRPEKPLFVSHTALQGGWVVQADLYASEFPSLKVVLESWNRAKARTAKAIARNY